MKDIQIKLNPWLIQLRGAIYQCKWNKEAEGKPHSLTSLSCEVTAAVNFP